MPNKLFLEWTKEELVELLTTDVMEWNKQREAHDGFVPKLSGADLSGADLSEANLGEAKLIEANLSRANLHKAKLSKADLYRANLHRAKLHDTDLNEVDLSWANLREAQFHKTKLKGTNIFQAVFIKVDLTNCDLSESIGAEERQFAEADLGGSELPPKIAFKSLEVLKETSKNARVMFITMLLACLYCWLTIGTTEDVQLLTNSANSQLPIINAAIPIVGFYLVAPLLILGLFVYFHLYLEQMWEMLGQLPVVFPDGKELPKRTYPWLLSSLVKDYIEHHRGKETYGRLRKWLTILLGWWAVPITLFALWFRYMTRHDMPVTALHTILLGVSIILAIDTFQDAVGKLKRQKKALSFSWLGHFTYRGHFIGLYFLVLLLGFSGWIIQGDRVRITWFDADFREKDIAERPEDWDGLEAKIRNINRPNLKDRNLNYLDAEDAFMVKADLRGASLKQAKLFNAELQSAIMQDAKLKEADLSGANLEGAVLSGAQLEGAVLRQAQLEGAVLRYAQLEGADLRYAQLEGADLRYAQLEGADLRRAKLEGADLWFAKLEGADLRRANLYNSGGLTLDKLQTACVYDNTILPDEIITEGAYFDPVKKRWVSRAYELDILRDPLPKR